MLEDFEKKLNKWLLDFVIGGSYLGEKGQYIWHVVRDFLCDVVDHLKEQENRFKKWYRS